MNYNKPLSFFSLWLKRRDMTIKLNKTDLRKVLQCMEDYRNNKPSFPDPKSFKKRREKLKYSQQEVSDKTGISVSVIYNIEQNKRSFSYNKVKELDVFYSNLELQIAML